MSRHDAELIAPAAAIGVAPDIFKGTMTVWRAGKKFDLPAAKRDQADFKTSSASTLLRSGAAQLLVAVADFIDVAPRWIVAQPSKQHCVRLEIVVQVECSGLPTICCGRSLFGAASRHAGARGDAGAVASTPVLEEGQRDIHHRSNVALPSRPRGVEDWSSRFCFGVMQRRCRHRVEQTMNEQARGP